VSNVGVISMLYKSRPICLHINSDNNDLTNHLIAPQTTGHRIKPFVSLEIVKTGEISISDERLMSPDSGTAIITFLLSGEADFSDSTHKRGTLKKNDVLWILSGSGIQYSLKPKTQDCVSVKLRVALSPALECAPAQSIYLESNLIERDGPAQVLLGYYGNAHSGFALPALMNYLVVRLSAGQEWVYEPPVNHRIAWVATISGKVKSSDVLVATDEIAVYENSNKSISFFAEEESIFLLGSSQEYTHDLALEKHSKPGLNEASDKGRFEAFSTFNTLMCI
jgi:redox-sensitive bicupin YhaK (pirin superfamily)